MSDATITGLLSDRQSSYRITIRSEKNPVPAKISPMSYNPQRALAALAAFQQSTGLRDFPWEKASGVGEGTLRRFRNKDNRSMSHETYERLAGGATQLLGRPVSAAEFRDFDVSPPVPISLRLGEGAVLFALDKPSGFAASPPDFTGDSAAIVEGMAGKPLFCPGDVLFCGREQRELQSFIGKEAVVQIKDGPRLLRRLLQGSRRGRYHLLGISDSTPMLEDQAIAWAAHIEWVRRAA
jgi:hypothetical protein